MSTSLFISHASEDKDKFVRPLAEALLENFSVWYDEYSLTLGDSLRQEIDNGLSTCDYGVVILSKNFFVKNWTQSELDGLFALEQTNKKVILPVWHDVEVEDITKYSPILASRLGIKSSKGIEAVVNAIEAATGAAKTAMKMHSKSDQLTASFIALDDEVTLANRHSNISNSNLGVEAAMKSARIIISDLAERLEIIDEKLSNFDFKLKEDTSSFNRSFISVQLPLNLLFNLEYSNLSNNTAVHSSMKISMYKCVKNFPDPVEYIGLKKETFAPYFPEKDRILWRAEGNEYEEGQIVDLCVELILESIKKETG